MPSKYWIKLYHEVLDDPKMARLPDRLYRRCIEVFLLAGKSGDVVLMAVLSLGAHEKDRIRALTHKERVRS